jgi:hypothetical protein
MRYDSAQLMLDILRMAKVPAGSTYEEADTALGMANDAMEGVLVPEVLKVSGGHLMAHKDTALVQSQSRYRFPERAIRPERLQLVNSEGVMLARIRLASGDMVDEVLAGRCPRGEAEGFWCAEDNHAVLALQNSYSATGMYLRMYYRRQPNLLVEVGGPKSGTVTLVEDVGGGQYQLTISFTSDDERTDFLDDLAAGSLMDLISKKPNFESKGDDLEAIGAETAGSGLAAITIDGDALSEAPVKGDYLCLAGYSPVPQIAKALFGPLGMLAAAAVLRDQGNPAQADAFEAKAITTISSAMTTATPRSDEAETVVNETW